MSSGRGQKVSISLFDTAISMQSLEAASHLNYGYEIRWFDLSLNFPVQVADGWVTVLGFFRTTPWRLICQALDLPDLSDLMGLPTAAEQAANREEIVERLRPAFHVDDGQGRSPAAGSGRSVGPCALLRRGARTSAGHPQRNDPKGLPKARKTSGDRPPVAAVAHPGFDPPGPPPSASTPPRSWVPWAPTPRRSPRPRGSAGASAIGRAIPCGRCLRQGQPAMTTTTRVDQRPHHRAVGDCLAEPRTRSRTGRSSRWSAAPPARMHKPMRGQEGSRPDSAVPGFRGGRPPFRCCQQPRPHLHQLPDNLPGGIEVSINTGYRGAALEHAIRRCGAKLIVVKTQFLPLVHTALPAVPALETVVVRDLDGRWRLGAGSAARV